MTSPDNSSTIPRPPAFAPASNAAFEVAVVRGEDLGRSIAVDASRPSPLLVGKGPACELRLADPTASRRHVSFEVSGDRLRLVDAGSTNGTFVNGLAVVEAYLVGGEHIGVGACVLEVRRCAGSAEARLPLATHFGRVVGASREMRRLYPLCERLAASDIPVVIEGETGTGKEALAEALHERGPRGTGPFVVFDCAGVPATMLEAELFGHERGAFTGAVSARRGVFEEAAGGTLFIDEIGELDASLQPKLLRVIERSEVRRIGANRPQAVDVRIVAATRRDLDREVQTGHFRDDLYHRLAVGRIELPALRRRMGDVRVLAEVFRQQMGGAEAALSESLLARWEQYAWPGNVRELRNAVARRLALGDLADLEYSLPARGSVCETTDDVASGRSIDDILAMGLPLGESRRLLLAEFERRYLANVLQRHGGNVRRSAAAAGVAKRHFQRLKSRG